MYFKTIIIRRDFKIGIATQESREEIRDGHFIDRLIKLINKKKWQISPFKIIVIIWILICHPDRCWIKRKELKVETVINHEAIATWEY